jgi:hypothetical protein
MRAAKGVLANRRSSLRITGVIGRLILGAVASGLLSSTVSADAGTPPKLGLSVKNGQLIKDGRPYRGVGANYFDLFLRVLHEPTNTSSLRGLERLGNAGIPFVRFATTYGAADLRIYFEQREEYFRRLDLVVRAAERSKVGLIPSMLWTPELPDLAGEHRDQWGNPESKTLAMMRQYVGDVVVRYKDSPALWGWEFGNELNLSLDLPNAAQFRKPGGTERDDLKAAHLAVMLPEFAREVRRHDTWRPIFSGNSHPRASAWHNTAEHSWKADTREEFKEIILRDNPTPLDTIGVHLYGATSVQKEMAAWVTNRLSWLRTLKDIARQAGRPVFIGEFGLPAKPGDTSTRAEFEQMIYEMETAEVDLAAFWVFDFPPQVGEWNVSFENDHAYRIQVTAEANRRWNRAALKERLTEKLKR